MNLRKRNKLHFWEWIIFCNKVLYKIKNSNHFFLNLQVELDSLRNNKLTTFLTMNYLTKFGLYINSVLIVYNFCAKDSKKRRYPRRHTKQIWQVLPLQVRVNPGAMVMKVNSVFFRFPELEPHHQMWFSIIFRISLFSIERGLTSVEDSVSVF